MNERRLQMSETPFQASPNQVQEAAELSGKTEWTKDQTTVKADLRGIKPLMPTVPLNPPEPEEIPGPPDYLYQDPEASADQTPTIPSPPPPPETIAPPEPDSGPVLPFPPQPMAAPSAAAPLPSPPSAAVSAASQLPRIPDEQRRFLRNPSFQHKMLMSLAAELGMRLSRLPPDLVEEMKSSLAMRIEEDATSGLADEFYGEMSASCQNIWGPQKIIRIFCALRAAEAILKAYIGGVQIEEN
jgi:hypothetical protein